MKNIPSSPSVTDGSENTQLQVKPETKRGLKLPILLAFMLTGIALATLWPKENWKKSLLPIAPIGEIAPLAMDGGSPHLRAMLRTISASESNDSSPYTLLYGGKHFQDLSKHPDQCLPIVAGPNKGLCTTAAGRYQFLTTTWEEKAYLYHPNPGGMMFWKTYSYEAMYQDRVVYNWLADTAAWGADIPELLETGNIDQVLRILSGTWTSLGYGIEDNWFTPSLPRIYKELLEDEIAMQSSEAIGNAIAPEINFRQ